MFCTSSSDLDRWQGNPDNRRMSVITKNTLVGLLIIMLICCGCVSIQPPMSSISDYQFASEKNYVLNVENTANVGDPIIIRKTYSYREMNSDGMKALNDFEFHGKIPLNSEVIRFVRKDEIIPVVGTTTKDNVTYQIVLIGDTNNGLPVGLLVRSDSGQVAGAVWRNGFGLWGTHTLNYRIVPKDSLFTLAKSVIIDREKPYENFEIIYTGMNGKNATFLYREYSADDLAKPAFYQNLTYDLESDDTIQFKQLKIKILKASNESIQFKVLSDS
jgi:hypothetical protein